MADYTSHIRRVIPTMKGKEVQFTLHEPSGPLTVTLKVETAKHEQQDEPVNATIEKMMRPVLDGTISPEELIDAIVNGNAQLAG